MSGGGLYVPLITKAVVFSIGRFVIAHIGGLSEGVGSFCATGGHSDSI